MTAAGDKPRRFEFAAATRIIFGAGVLLEIGPLAKEMGRRALVVTGRHSERAAGLLTLLAEQDLECRLFPVAGEPTIEMARAGALRAREAGCDLVIGFGGGGALDAGKAIAALATNHGDVLDYLEVIGRAQPITQPPLPFIAIPTTAGTGTEVTRNAVLASPAHRVKASLRSPLLLPRLALVDSQLTHDLPRDLTASTGLDALTQLIEPFVSSRAQPMTDALGREGIRRVARSLRRACEEPHDTAAREDMTLASLFGGLALANAGLGAVHGFAAPLGGMFPAPHGAVCAALLPLVMEVNLRALRQRAPTSAALPRYEEIAHLLTGDAGATADAGVAWTRELCAALEIPRLRHHGVTQNDLPLLCEKSAAASSMKGNPIALTTDELREILERAL